MAKITYLFGAGASAMALPTVNQIPKKLREVIIDYEQLLKNAKKEELVIDEIEVIKDVIHGFSWLEEESKRHASIDTFAKKLFVTNKWEELINLKIFTSLFFSILQIKEKVDPRYDHFFASIIGNSIKDLPKDISIVSWNYDNQFEIAFKEYSKHSDVEVQEAFLGMTHKNFPSKIDIDKFKIFKINGSSSLFTFNDGKKLSILDKVDYEYNNDFLLLMAIEKFVNIERYYTNSQFESSLSFAWENEGKNKNVIDVICNDSMNCETLVVIGYSVPFFNRKIDKKIIDSMENLRTIYIQDVNPEIVKQRLEQLIPRNELSSIEWKFSTDLFQFLIPYEL